MNNIVNAFLLFFTRCCFPIVNPVGSAPLFLRITRGRSTAERSALRAAWRSTVSFCCSDRW